MQNTDVLIFAEDPGAANYVAQLPTALAERDRCTRFLADGLAKDHLLQRGVRPEVVHHPAAADRILASVGPRLLIVGTAGNPNTLGLALVAEARLAGVESIGVVDLPMNAGYRFRGRTDNPLAYAPDWLLVPDEWTKEAYTALGYPAQRVVVCGHPHYDYVRATRARLAREDQNTLRQRVLLGAPDGRKVVVFATEGSARLKPQPNQRLAEYTLTGRGTSTGRTEVVLEEFLDTIRLVKSRPYLVLRLHPKDSSDDYTAYLHEFDLVSSGGSPLELIHAADLVVGSTSMFLLEAVLLGTVTLSVVPRALETDWLPSIRAGMTTCVTTRAQLRTTLVDLLDGRSPTPRVDVDDAIPHGSLEGAVEFVETRLECARTN